MAELFLKGKKWEEGGGGGGGGRGKYIFVNWLKLDLFFWLNIRGDFSATVL